MNTAPPKMDDTEVFSRQGKQMKVVIIENLTSFCSSPQRVTCSIHSLVTSCRHILFYLTKKTMIFILITFLKRTPQGGSILMWLIYFTFFVHSLTRLLKHNSREGKIAGLIILQTFVSKKPNQNNHHAKWNESLKLQQIYWVTLTFW